MAGLEVQPHQHYKIMKIPLNRGRKEPALVKFDLRMKISLLLLFTGMFAINARTSYSQNTKVSVDLKNVTVEKFIDYIEEKTEYRFLYLIDDINLHREVTITVRNEKINVILDKIFSGSDTTYSIEDKQISLVRRSGQTDNNNVQFTISGKVIDSTGTVLAGANILEKGTTNGTQTDFDGNYSINVSGPESVLVFSYVGFQSREIKVGDRTSVNITLIESAEGLEEVVVVGYGSVKRTDVTGAVSTVNSEELTALPTSDVQQALKGRASGVRVVQNSGQPGANVQIQIREETPISATITRCMWLMVFPSWEVYPS